MLDLDLPSIYKNRLYSVFADLSIYYCYEYIAVSVIITNCKNGTGYFGQSQKFFNISILRYYKYESVFEINIHKSM